MYRAIVVFILLVTVGLWHCAPSELLAGIHLRAVTPTAIEAGSELELAGDGLPNKRPQSLVFVGKAYRPAMPEERVSWSMSVGEWSPDRIHWVPTESEIDLICRGKHTTFVGRIELRYENSMHGEPAMVGVLDHLSLDFYPPLEHQGDDDQAQRALRSLQTLGITVADATAIGRFSEGLLVANVREGSVAADAGMVANDRITRVDSVHVERLSDAMPSGGPFVKVTVLRAGGSIDYSLQNKDRSQLTPREIGIAVAAIVLLTALWFWARRAEWNLQVVPGTLLAKSLVFMPIPVVAAIALNTVSIDLVTATLVLFVVLIALSVAAKTSGHRVRALGWRGLLAMAIAVVVAVSNGQVQVEEIVTKQGFFPWQWHAFGSPLGLIFFAFATFTLSSTRAIRSDVPVMRAPDVDDSWIGAQSSVWLSTWICIVFLGGWRMPENVTQSSVPISVLVLVVKVYGLLSLEQLWLSLTPALRLDLRRKKALGRALWLLSASGA